MDMLKQVLLVLIFSLEKKNDDSVPTSHNVEVPNIDVDADGFLTLMDKKGSTRKDLRLPDDTYEDKALASRIREAHNEGRDVVLTVIESIKIEKVAEMSDKK